VRSQRIARATDWSRSILYEAKRRSLRVDSLSMEIGKAEQELVSRKKVELVVSSLIERMYTQAIGSIEPLLNFGIRSVYPRLIESKVIQSIERGKPTFQIKVVDGGEPVSLGSAHGGGLSQIIGFLLRVIVIILSGRRRFMILDESFSAVSRDLQPSLSELIRKVTEDLGFQIILITHSEDTAFEADKVYAVEPGGNIKELNLF